MSVVTRLIKAVKSDDSDTFNEIIEDYDLSLREIRFVQDQLAEYEKSRSSFEGAAKRLTHKYGLNYKSIARNIMDHFGDFDLKIFNDSNGDFDYIRFHDTIQEYMSDNNRISLYDQLEKYYYRRLAKLKLISFARTLHLNNAGFLVIRDLWNEYLKNFENMKYDLLTDSEIDDIIMDNTASIKWRPVV